MPAEAVDRNLGMLWQRIGGATLQQIGDAHGVTPQTVHVIVNRTGRRHVEDVLLGMWSAQRADALLVLAVPAGFDHEQQLTLKYAEWLVGELVEHGAEPQLHYRPAGFDGGFVIALEDRAFTRLIEEAEAAR